MMLALGRHLFESTIFAVAVGLMVLFLRKRGAAVRHLLWFIASAKFAVPIGLFSSFGVSLQGFFSSIKVSVTVPQSLSTLLLRQTSSPAVIQSDSGVFSFPILIWLAGSLTMLAVWLPKLFASVGLSESHRELDEDSFLRLKRRIGLRRNVRLRFSDSKVEPALSGFWRPAVIIPEGLPTRLSASELESVVLHELAHAKRWDNWTGAFAHALACIFWFHPLLWWIERRLHWERELACDEMVIRCGAAARDYVAGILKVCRFHLNESLAGVSSVSGSNLKNRVEVIMSLSTDAPVPRFPKVLVATLIVIVTIIPIVIGLVAAPKAAAQSANSETRARNLRNQGSPVTCVFASVVYPEGTVIQDGSGPEQMCALVLDPAGNENKAGAPPYSAQWIHTSKEIRERSRNVVRLPQPPPPQAFVCTPKPATQEKLCSCEEGSPFSQNSIVNSVNGKLRCDQGKWVSIASALAEQK
jgi:beta-lactamase regulating signal transducer with metallopeptidase domain